MRVWRLIAHHKHPDTAINWFRTSSRVAIGWGRIGDLRHLQGPEEIRERIQQRPAEYVERAPDQLWTEPADGENVRWTLLRVR